MHRIPPLTAHLVLASLLIHPLGAVAYDSGSTGADGPLNPTVNTQLQLPPSGVFNFTTVNIPAGVTVTFQKNTSNTPVVILASGNVSVAGSINLNGSASAHTGSGGDGNLGDDGLPGEGGTGGYSGGNGGRAGVAYESRSGGAGLGPGAGDKGSFERPTVNSAYAAREGGAAGHNGNGATGQSSTPVGQRYGSSLLLPLLGGSGGGGGAGGNKFMGSGGGGGGGAILIASSGTLSVTGSIYANGGASGSTGGSPGCGGVGGAGSGGGIRLVATRIEGNGTLSAVSGAIGGKCGVDTEGYNVGYPGASAPGYIRLESESFARTSATSPTYTFGSPGDTFIAGLPTLRIARVAGVEAPEYPTGVADITLPADTANPVTVEFATTGVPVGNTVKLTVTPIRGAASSVVSPALVGSTEAAGASVQINLPAGPSTLSATTTYTIVTAMGEALSRYAGGEPVDKVTLVATPGQATKAILITRSGKEFEVPHAVLAMQGG